MDTVNTEKLMHDMRAVVIDAEELLKATAAQTGERIEKVRAKAEGSVRAAREQLLAAGEKFEVSAKAAAKDVNDQVHKHPWATAGVAAGVGVLVGLLIGRR
jgi:ElaB/YqjD/DUF883 family membrane-anchored ribosome-binding protein